MTTLPSAAGRTRFTGFSIAFIVLVLLFARLDLRGTDFDSQFYLAGKGWPDLYGAVPLRPLQSGGYYGIFLPWAVALVQPIALLPLVWARAVVQAATVLALGIASGARPSAWIVALSSAPALLLISYYANLDAIAAAGVLLPPAGGLLLLAAKPQAAGLAVVVWLAQGKWRSFAPAVLVIALSTSVWSEWTLRVQESVAGALNISLFPYSLLAAAPLLVIAVRKNDPLLAAVITPLVVPYVAFYSVAPAIALLARRHLALGIAGNALSWGVLWLLVERLAAAR